MWNAELFAIDNFNTWWRHQMETFSALLAIWAENSPVTGEFPAQRPATRSFDVFFDLHLNKRLSKQSWGWWFETPLHPLWRHCNECRNKGVKSNTPLPSNVSTWITTSAFSGTGSHCPACRTTLIATRFWVVMICPIIKCLTVLRVFFSFVWFVFIHHNFQFYFELCTYCNILDIYLS